jgi:DNA repair exonuclease SbcCD ATPase subunit
MPEEVRDQIEARAVAGERITVADVERLKREAKAAREAAARLEAEQRTAAETARAAIENAVRQAREQAEEAAALKADALAEEALARRRGDVAQLERRAKEAEEEAQAYQATARRWAADAERHREYLARAGSAEREAPGHIDAAEKLMAALSDAMIALHGFEHAPIPHVARRWAMAQQMSAQMAEAITAFLAPRVDPPARGAGSA